MGKRVKPGPYKGATSYSQGRRNRLRRDVPVEITPTLGPVGGGGKTRKDIARDRAKNRKNAERELNKWLRK